MNEKIRTILPSNDIWVALDLEATGLDKNKDAIIEVGAVKFKGNETLDTFSSLVRTDIQLSDFIIQLTGIHQEELDHAPKWEAVAPQLSNFVGDSGIICHNTKFDLEFLEAAKLSFDNPVCDTWDMAYVLLPSESRYSLQALAERFNATHKSPHRALSDAIATQHIFRKLLSFAKQLDQETLNEMLRLAQKSNWVLGDLLNGLSLESEFTADNKKTERTISVLGIDEETLNKRLSTLSPLNPKDGNPIKVSEVEKILSSDGPLSKVFPAFEVRTEQIEMANAVAEAINSSSRLTVEAGTGVGKSLAYLIPGAIYALSHNKTVVISTNTINLQEQLIKNDVPKLHKALESINLDPAEELKCTLLKGRSNYLCLERTSRLHSSENLTDDEARMLAKTMTWLKNTHTGDREELNLGYQAARAPWNKLSSENALKCMHTGRPCFLKSARQRAEGSHLIITNHALVLSDMVMGGGLLPDYDVLIMDEAHHIEEEATKHLGFEISNRMIRDHLESISGNDASICNIFPRTFLAIQLPDNIRETLFELTQLITKSIEITNLLFNDLSSFAQSNSKQLNSSRTNSIFARQIRLRVIEPLRTSPSWTEIVHTWDILNTIFLSIHKNLGDLEEHIHTKERSDLPNIATLSESITNAVNFHQNLADSLNSFLSNPDSMGIYWISRLSEESGIYLNMAPLNVSKTLEENLFSKKSSIIMTGATISTNGTFDHFRNNTGFNHSKDLILGSPFDYETSAALFLPNDISDPNQPTYQNEIEDAILEATITADGRTMALFTSYASLRKAFQNLQPRLQAENINVIAQRPGDSPDSLRREFMKVPKSVLLGTSSFWEGVDLPGDHLKVLIITRLPFHVPTDPIHSAREEQYENSFMDYSIPLSIIKLRQGLGRLIRTESDKGIAIILDSRLTKRRYGTQFLNSLPEMTQIQSSLATMSDHIYYWTK
ncbi:MAG: helicase C-terminal domain-containing protein [Dehalococcoidia bacterium]